MITNRGAVYIAIVLLQSVPVIYNSDTPSSFINPEPIASPVSKEKIILAVERRGSERQKEELRCEREFWEKVPEDRTPQGTFWEVVQLAWDCRVYGKCEDWGML